VTENAYRAMIDDDELKRPLLNPLNDENSLLEPFVSNYQSLNDVQSHFSFDKDDLQDIPITVQETLQLADRTLESELEVDPKVSCITFRYIVLSILFIVPGAIIDTVNSYRTTSADFSILLVQLLSNELGKLMAKTLPNRRVNLRWFSFSLNPGPWSTREAVLVTITAASGATGNQGTECISLAKIFYDEDTSPIIAILFMYCIVWVGYSYAAIAKSFVLYNPKFIWPKALMQTALFKSQSKTGNTGVMRVFVIALSAMTLWQFLPEYLFPMTSSLAVLCWIAPYNETANFIGSGLGGMGVLNFSLDWSNITSTVMLSPYWTIVIQFLGFAASCWVLVPFFKWYKGGIWSLGIMSNHLLTSTGEVYPTDKLISKNLTLNETAFNLYGPVYMGAQRVWGIFFDYAAYSSAIAWIAIFAYKDVKYLLIRLKEKLTQQEKSASADDEPLYHAGFPRIHKSSSKFHDIINKRYSVYEDIPNSWFLALFGLSFVILSSIFLTNSFYLPWIPFIIALFLGSIIITPLAYLYALSNFQLPIGTVNALLYGSMVHVSNAQVHPISGSVYTAIAGNAWYRAQFMLLDWKLGMYNNIPPKCVFFSQLFGNLMGVPFNYLALRWVVDTKLDYLRGTIKDPLNQWTGQELVNLNTNVIQYVLLGPQRLFQNYKILPFGFLLGLLAPLAIYKLYIWDTKRRLKFDLWNSTILFSTMSHFYGNISTGYLSKFLLGTFSMFYLFRFKHRLFSKFNYILAAAFDTGYNINVIILLILSTVTAKLMNDEGHFVHWWGNNSQSVERCFAL